MSARHALVFTAALAGVASSASATEVLFSTGWSNWTFSESELCGSPPLANESADDFDLVGNIDRVYVNGYNSCIAICTPPPLAGAHVRFYEWTDAGPGTLQKEYFVPGGDAGLAYNPQDITTVDVTLPTPFAATGKHYVSVQLEFDSCFFWAYWVANPNAPMGGAAYRRTDGGAWNPVTGFQMSNCDLSFSLLGTIGPPEPTEGCGTWYLQTSPNPEGMQDTWLNDLAIIAPDDMWAVGRTYGQATLGDFNTYTVAMHFDGADWTIVPTPNPAPVEELTWCELNAVAAISSNDVWAAGVRVDTDGGAGYVGLHNLVLHWDGSSWQEMPAPIPPSFGSQGVSGDGIYDILALSANDIWFLGEWITLNEQGFTFRSALAMHWDGSGFTLHPTPVVGSNGATIYASDAAAPNDIWAAGASGDGDPGTTNWSYIYHWNGSTWSHVPFTPAPGYWHSYGGVKALASDDVWISGSAWAPPDEITNYMLHWNGSAYEYFDVPFAGGPIIGEPPNMYVFGGGGVTHFDGTSFSDAQLDSGLEFLAWHGFGAVELTGACEMLAVGAKDHGGDARSLVAKLVPVGGAAGAASPDVNGDGAVNGADITLILGYWNTAATWSDINGDGTVDGADLTLLLGEWTG